MKAYCCYGHIRDTADVRALLYCWALCLPDILPEIIFQIFYLHISNMNSNLHVTAKHLKNV